MIGVWLGFGVGAPKQYFIIRKVGNKLRGMVCGTCDNPYTMAALDDFEIQGDTLKFNILHEDWGDGELPTFYKHVTGHVGWNEIRCTTAADHQSRLRPTRATRLCPWLFADRANCDRGHGRKPLARMAASEHFPAPLALLEDHSKERFTMSSDSVLVDLNREYIRSIQESDVGWFDRNLAEDFLCSNPMGPW